MKFKAYVVVIKKHPVSNKSVVTKTSLAVTEREAINRFCKNTDWSWPQWVEFGYEVKEIEISVDV